MENTVLLKEQGLSSFCLGVAVLFLFCYFFPQALFIGNFSYLFMFQFRLFYAALMYILVSLADIFYVEILISHKKRYCNHYFIDPNGGIIQMYDIPQ